MRDARRVPLHAGAACAPDRGAHVPTSRDVAVGAPADRIFAMQYRCVRPAIRHDGSCFAVAGLVLNLSMSCSRKFLIFIIAVIIVVDLLPMTREKLAWRWALTQNSSDAYLAYLGKHPDGKHVDAAKQGIEARRPIEARSAEITEDMVMSATARTPKKIAANRIELAAKQDDFFWKRTLSDNSVSSYNAYLERFPNGKHVEEARQKLATPGLPTDDTNH
jgi:hypothetical protein